MATTTPTPLSFLTERRRQQVVVSAAAHHGRGPQASGANIARSPLYNGRFAASASVLSVARRQGHAVSRPGAAPALPGAGGLDVDEIYVNGMSMSLPARRPGAIVRRCRTRRGGDDPSWLCRGIRLRPADRVAVTLETQPLRRTVPGRTDQRHVGLRRGGRRRGSSRDQRGALGATARPRGSRARRGVYRHHDRRSGHARGASSRIGCSPRAPSSGCCCGSTTRTCGSRRAAGPSVWLTTTRWDVFRRAGASGRNTRGCSARRCAVEDRSGDRALSAVRSPGVSSARSVSLDECRPDSGSDCTTSRPTVKYAGYLRRQVPRSSASGKPDTADSRRISLRRASRASREVIQRLTQARPSTLGQARRIPGVTPAAVDAAQRPPVSTRRA